MGIPIRFMVAAACAATALSSLAWSGGHNVVGHCVLQKLPAEWRARFKEEWRGDFEHATHLPDTHDVKLLTRCAPEDLEWFRRHCGITDNSVPLHSPPAFFGAIERLVRAIRAGDDRMVFVYLASISHSLADPAACNHDPIIHLPTYMWGDNALGVMPKTKNYMPVDFGFAEFDADTRAVLQRRLDALKPMSVPPDLTPERLYAQILRWECLAAEPCCNNSQRIVEEGAKWMMNSDREAKCAVTDALCDLGLWAVVRTLYVFDAARLWAAKGEIETDEGLWKRAVAGNATNIAEVCRRPMSGDSFACPYFAEEGRPSLVRSLYDPTAHMASSALGILNRPLGCQIVGSLKRLRPNLNASLMDVREFVRDGLDPKTTPCLVMHRHVCGYKGFDVRKFNVRLDAYLKAGGKLIWVNGAPPAYALGKEVLAAFSNGGRKDGYCDPAYPVSLDVLMKSSLAWIGAGGTREWKYRRRPNGKAGWYWEGSPYRFDAAKLPKDARPIVELRTPEGTFTSGIVRGNVAYLPMNALFPYCVTDEKPQFVPFRLSLDSAGEAILLGTLDELGVR